MASSPKTNNPFEHYFYKRAQLADHLANSGCLIDAYTLATASLDAIAEIWMHDFPQDNQNLKSELGVEKVPSSIRLARLFKKFIPSDSLASRVAVICFAEDWKLHHPEDAAIADSLLIKRMGDDPDPRIRDYEMPKAYLDVSRDELSRECPELAARSDLFDLSEHYEYGALLYTFYRCPLVHIGLTSNRTHGFTRGEEVWYCGSSDDNDNRLAIGFGPNLVTRWLRSVASGYVQVCIDKCVSPAQNLDAGADHETRFKRRWSKITKVSNAS
ncbi:MAG: hypothetical protein AAGH67_13540 [Cyanobacteria bacterium P01_H01_bin.162]